MKHFALCYLELAQPIKALNDPQIKIPRPRPMVLIIGTTAMFPVDEIYRRKVLFPIQKTSLSIELIFI